MFCTFQNLTLTPDMSEPRRICVCGRERGNKEPVIITITTCRHKHPPNKGEGSFCISSPPHAQSSPIVVHPDSNSAKSSSGSKGKDNGSLKHDETVKDANDTAYVTATAVTEAATDPNVTATDTNETADVTAIDANETPNETVLEETGNNAASNIEITENQGEAVAGEVNELLDQTENQEIEPLQLTDGIENETNDPVVMMLTETGVNTMPFLDNLFRYNNSTKSMPNFFEDPVKKDNNNCTVELLILEKHAKNCSNNPMNFTNNNTFFDGDSFFETIGRLSLPTCLDVATPNPTKSEPLVSSLKNATRTRADQYTKILNKLERYFRSQKFNRDEIVPMDLKLQKYITLGKDINRKSSGYEVEELFSRTLTTDRSVQFEDQHSLRRKATKWYDAFLMCFGIKDLDDAFVFETRSNKPIPENEPSYLITKYLRI